MSGAELIDAIQNSSFHILQQKKGASPRTSKGANVSTTLLSLRMSSRMSSRRSRSSVGKSSSREVSSREVSEKSSADGQVVREVQATVSRGSSFARNQASQPVSVVVVQPEVD